jgi:hypothetical protein
MMFSAGQHRLDTGTGAAKMTRPRRLNATAAKSRTAGGSDDGTVKIWDTTLLPEKPRPQEDRRGEPMQMSAAGAAQTLRRRPVLGTISVGRWFAVRCAFADSTPPTWPRPNLSGFRGHLSMLRCDAADPKLGALPADQLGSARCQLIVAATRQIRSPVLTRLLQRSYISTVCQFCVIFSS